MKVWVQKWTETERGWGQRPDGYTLHENREDIDLFLRAMRKREQQGQPPGYVPDEYSRPEGTPYEAEIEPTILATRTLLDKLCASAHGMWGPGGIWGASVNSYPPPINPKDGQDGWVKLKHKG